MGAVRDSLGVVIALIYCYISIKFILPIVSAAPLRNSPQQDRADDRMVKPPRFPYDGPFGFYSSGLLCKFDGTVYIGGWFGRSCAGPIAPFMQPTPPSTTPTTTTIATTTTELPTTQVTTPAPYHQYQYYSPEQLSWFQQMMMNYNGYGNNNYHQHQPASGHDEDPPEDEYDYPTKDDDSIFIETYGYSASRPGYKLGDPNGRK